jgi:DNA-binding NtrC family response regulator
MTNDDPQYTLLGSSEQTKALIRQITKVAASDSRVLITGETGVGKEIAARMLYELSPRRFKGSFIALNCAGLQDTLIESELFGHARGAFTGAVHSRTGLIKEANNGVLFLDEVGDMPMRQQARLLRFLSSGTYRSLGSNIEIRSNARVITATNKSLEELADRNLFRWDLYYRINIIQIHIPPLRERVQDIEDIAQHYANSFQVHCDTAFIKGLQESYNWPGNVRELIHYIEAKAALLKPGDTLRGPSNPTSLYTEQNTFHTDQTTAIESEENPQLFTHSNKIGSILVHLLDHRGHITRTANACGMTREGLNKFLRRHNIGSLLCMTADRLKTNDKLRKKRK